MKLIAPLSLFAFLAVGCNSGLDQQSATKVMSSALGGTGAAQTMLKPTSGSANATFNGTIQNPSGSGSAQVSGSTTSSSGGWDMSFDITFAHWADLASNVTIDGALHETASFTTMSPLVGSVKISGHLTATGSVQGAVDFNLDVSYTSTKYQVTGNVGGATLNVTVNL
jgi:hypothetical protein